MSRILAFSGKKQSGKNTLCNFLHGQQLRAFGVIDGFEITTDGELVVDTILRDEDGKEKRGKGFIDITRTDLEFAVWAMDNVWPFVKHYAFATTLKDIAMGLFELEKSSVYGTDEEKNKPTQYTWEDMPTKVKGKTGAMSGRDFIQYFGTEICRKIFSEVWTSRTIKDIQLEESKLAIISDARFVNEVEAVKNAGGKVIRLTRSVAKDNHQSESALDNYTEFDAVIDTQNLNIEESCQALTKILEEWGWSTSELILANKEVLPEPPRKQTVTTIR
jgi:hypothetical protein